MLIDVIAPSSPFDPDGLREGVALLEARGHTVRHRADLFERERFLAGTDARRGAELVEGLESDADVLWCARGGYGATRLLPKVPPTLIRRANKLLVGFSDITALHALWWLEGTASVHGPMVARLAAEAPDTLERVFDVIECRSPPLSGLPLVSGRAHGRLTGGNLAVLAALCGTPWQPDLRGAVVFLEDIGERPYRLDRAFVQCSQAGLFEGVSGFVFGDFTNCDEPGGRVTARQVIEEHAERLGVPAVTGVRSGHGERNDALLFGVPVRLDADAGTLEWEHANS